MKIIRNITSALLCLSLGMGMCVPTKAAETAKMRRPVSPESPMWIVHIDTWYNSDPEKIIDLIPGDILPYVVFNISMNPSWSEEEQRYRHFAGLLELCHKYGGYLIDSWCGNQWEQSISPLAMIKRIPEFEKAARLYSDNFIFALRAQANARIIR